MKLYVPLFILFFFGMLGCDEPTQRETVTEPSAEKDFSMASEGFLPKNTPIFHTSHEPKKQQSPFSDVVEVGGLYFLSGQIGMDHSTRTLVSGGIESETVQTLENIKDVLAQHKLEMTDVIKATVILDDIGDFAIFNTIYSTYFPQKPARTTFAAEALARGAKIEIEVIASRGN